MTKIYKQKCKQCGQYYEGRGKYFCSYKCRGAFGMSDVSCIKISVATTGENNPFYGKKHSKEVKEKISELLSGKNHPMYGKKRLKHSNIMLGNSNPMFGMHHSVNARKKISESKIGKKRKAFSYETRKRMGESKYGENNPQWQGGISNYQYSNEWTRSLREKVRIRDFNYCQFCGIIQECLSYKLSVHHIDYDKENCSDNNLISLCRICHTKTNTNRGYWMDYFINKSNKEYYCG